MAILMPTIPATLRRQTGFTSQGRPTWGRETSLKVAVISLHNKAERSSVRADSSASRGRAEEARADGTVLIPPTYTVSVGDQLHLLGQSYEITSVFPRHDLGGELGHTQVELNLLAGT